MKKLSTIFAVLVGVCAILAIPSNPAFAQSVRGSLSGSVLDQSGAAISGAAVTVRDPNTGVVRSTVSSTEGSYRFSELNLGSYDVTASAPGFSTLVQRGVQITIGDVSALNLTLTRVQYLRYRRVPPLLRAHPGEAADCTQPRHRIAARSGRMGQLRQRALGRSSRGPYLGTGE